MAGIVKAAFYLADQNPHRDRTKGITVYSDALIRELASRKQLQLSALVSRSSYRPDSGTVNLVTLPLRTDRGVSRLLVDQLHCLTSRSLADVWHYPKGFLPIALRYSQPIVGTVHDVILQHYADYYPGVRSRLQYGYWVATLKRSISRFDAILTVSDFSRMQIEAFGKRHRLRMPPITSAVEGTDWEITPANSPQKADYVLHLGSVEPHKQTRRLLEWWNQLETERSDYPRLLVVGSLRAEDRQLLAELKTAEHRATQAREALFDLFGAAQALILPSEIEGFGLPALEAYAALTPVVYVANTAVEEVVGPGTPGAFQLSDYDSFRAALDAVLAMPAEQIRSIRDRLAERYTWDRCAETVLRIYREVGLR